MEQIPHHLQMRYRLRDNSGKTLMVSRNFSDLKTDKGPEQEGESLDKLRHKWERTNITTWDFEKLPDKIPIQSAKNKLLGFAYPAVSLEKQGNVSIRLYSDPAESRRVSREGMLALYSLQFPKQFKLLKKECVLPSSLWALYEGLDSRQNLNEELYNFVLETIFACKEGTLPRKYQFFHLVESLKKEGLYNRTKQLMDLVLQLLRERRATLDQIGRIKEMVRTKSRSVISMDVFLHELTEIVPADFLKQFNQERVSSAIRYCKALQIRIERAYVSPEKEKIKAGQLAHHADKLKKFKPKDPSPTCLELVQEYRSMLEEYKISLFAQEIKTLFPISAKRLEKKWQEISCSC